MIPKSVHQLTEDELSTARLLWHALKAGSLDAHDRFQAASQKIQFAVLMALDLAVSQKHTEDDPFE